MKSSKYSPIKIILIYIVIGGLWIVLTDYYIRGIIVDVETLTLYQTYKGWLFVIITSSALYYLIKKHDNELEEAEKKSDVYNELLQKLFDRIPAMITMYNPGLNEITLNKAFENRLGYNNKANRKVEDLFEELFPDPATRRDVFDYMSNPGKKWKEFALTSKNGESVPTSWSNIQLSNETQIGIGIDLTEIKEKENQLKESKKLLEKTLNSLKESVIMIDLDARVILDCNNATTELFGYSRDELIGSTTNKLHIDEDHYKKFNDIGYPKLMQNSFFQTEFKMKNKEGKKFETDHTVSLVHDENDKREIVVSVIRNISTQKKYERDLKNTIKEKETLLQEVHHRVKNNLALVVGFLWLQKERVENHHIEKILDDNILRIKSIAIVHELLYQSEQLSKIELETYFNELIDAISSTLHTQMNIQIDLVCKGIYLNVNQALPCALIANELISNSLKHAFRDKKQKDPLISVALSEANDIVYLKVSDNGTGIPENFDSENYSMGYHLIHTLVEQLDGDFKLDGNNGTTAMISFEKKKVKGSASYMV